MQLEFGNPEHIDIAKRGMFCICGHNSLEHKMGTKGECNAEVETYCQCSCGNEYETYEECKCDGFRPNNKMRFDSEKGVFKK